MFNNLFRSQPKHKHARLAQRDSESLDSDTLLQSQPSTESLPTKARVLDQSSRDIKIAVRTLILSSIIYLGVGLWLTSSIRNTTVVADADDFCLHHVSRYCKRGESYMVSLCD
jgi:hypothetical protein